MAINTKTNLLMLILVILLIYCIMYHFKYNGHKSNQYLDSKTNIIKKLENIQNNNINRSKENFQMTLDDFEKYWTDLQLINSTVDNIDIDKMASANEENQKKMSNLLKTIYGIQYIDYVNKGNADSYKEYLKYKTPEANIFYQSILSS